MAKTNTATATIFGRAIAPDCGFIQACIETSTINVNGKDVPVYYFNVVNSIYSMSLFSKNILPNRGFRCGDIYRYFGWSPKNRDHGAFVDWLKEIRDALSNGRLEITIPSREEAVV
jgi:hypothetical protein